MTFFVQAVRGPDGQPLDQIRLAGVKAHGFHGVEDHEKTDGQEFLADIALHLDARLAASTDRLDNTVSYAEVAGRVHDILTGPSQDLLETVAEMLAAAALEFPGVHAVDVVLHKPQAPIGVPFADVAVAIRRDHLRRPPVLPAPASGELPVAVPARRSDPVPPAVEPHPVPSTAAVPPVVPAPAVLPSATLAGESADRPRPNPHLDTPPAGPVAAVLALGSNLGDSLATLRAAIADLDRVPGLTVEEVSALARTAPVGGPPGQPDFFNAVLKATTTLSPRALLAACLMIETAHGRQRLVLDGPRTLDIDVITYGDLAATEADLTIPHPRACERAFVLVPWAQLDAEASLPGLGGGPVHLLAETAPDRAGLRSLQLDWLAAGEGPARPAAHPAPAVNAAGPWEADPSPVQAAAAPAEAGPPMPDWGW